MRKKPNTIRDERQRTKAVCDEGGLFAKADNAPHKPTDDADWGPRNSAPPTSEMPLPETDGAEINLESDGANTMFGYMYRDADNYKMFKDVILRGRLSRADILRMLNGVFDYKRFIPSDVGLQNLQPLFGNGWEIEADHPWHEIREITYVDGAPTADEFQNVMTAAELLAKWPSTADGWDNIGAEERLIESMGLSKGSKKKLKEDGW